MSIPALMPADPHQALRVRRLLMAAGSYCFTTFLVVFFYTQSLLPGTIVIHFVAAVVLINTGFYLAIRLGHNLRARDPSLTSPQIVCSLLPPLYVMYFLEEARAVVLMIAIVPFLYGVFRLVTHQFLIISLWFVGGYALVIALMAMHRPETLNLRLELIQLFTLTLVLSQVTLLGGYMSSLRSRLRERNHALEEALGTIQEMAIHDELTGIHNRRHLQQALETEIQRCQRGGKAFCLAMFDLDHFKQINDQLGHQRGDEVLRRFARNMAQTLRATDHFGRWGGEEFLAILTGTDATRAIRTVERLRQRASRIATGRHREEHITVSAGLAEYQPGDDPASLLARADAALYEAKEQGRNRLVTAPE